MSKFAPGLLDGKTALITGGGTGIGLAVAQDMGALGARVAIVGRRGQVLGAAADSLRKSGYSVLDETCDIRDPEQIAEVVDRVLERFGGLDILVNNAGGQFPTRAEDLAIKGWDAVIRNNLSGTWYVTQAIAKKVMIPRKSGRIVNVIANIERGFPGMVHTGAARAGVDNLTKTLAVEWAPYEVAVNAVAPGIIETDALSQYGDVVTEAGKRRTPAKRLGSPEEVADAVVFLASAAASYITGVTLYIDGGARLWGETWPIPDPE